LCKPVYSTASLTSFFQRHAAQRTITLSRWLERETIPEQSRVRRERLDGLRTTPVGVGKTTRHRRQSFHGAAHPGRSANKTLDAVARARK